MKAGQYKIHSTNSANILQSPRSSLETRIENLETLVSLDIIGN